MNNDDSNTTPTTNDSSPIIEENTSTNQNNTFNEEIPSYNDNVPTTQEVPNNNTETAQNNIPPYETPINSQPAMTENNDIYATQNNINNMENNQYNATNPFVTNNTNVETESPELKWNWGAFMFNWIYFMSFKTSLGFAIFAIIIFGTVIIDLILMLLMPTGLKAVSIIGEILVLLMFLIPFIISIYFGMKGSKIVWDHTEHTSVKEFNASQKILNRFGFITFIVMLILIVLYFIIITIVILAASQFLHAFANNHAPSTSYGSFNTQQTPSYIPSQTSPSNSGGAFTYP
ncbi:hypothetical protein M1145_02470 [Patescibacteria group bacterium]|nr:hypothetical protein [Patescibacteria group bacterium]